MRIDSRPFPEMAQFQLRAARAASGHRHGERESRISGSGLEFADFRRYQPGDALNRVDWNVYMRLQQVYVRLFHEDRDLQVNVHLDATGSMGVGTKLDYAANVAALLCVIGLHRRDRVLLSCIGGDEHDQSQFVRGCGVAKLPMFMKMLEGIQAHGHGSEHVQLLASSGRSKSDQSYLISDLLMDDPDLDSLMRCLSVTSKSPVLIHVIDRADVTLNLRRHIDAIDVETGVRLKLAGNSELQKAYQNEVTDWLDRVQRAANRYRVRYVVGSTHTSARDLLLGPLRNAGLLQSRVST